MESPKNSLNKVDWVKLQNNFMIFASPIFVIYLGAISALISQPNHVVSFLDFVPNQIILGMMFKQLIDTTLDIFRKYSAGK